MHKKQFWAKVTMLIGVMMIISISACAPPRQPAYDAPAADNGRHDSGAKPAQEAPRSKVGPDMDSDGFNMNLPKPLYNTEEYSTTEENGFKSVVNNPISTFSIDVDTASYTLIRRMINDGRRVEKDAVRIEEMINYFSYDYPSPKGDTPFSITSEIADCPWNDNTKLLLIGLQGKKVDTNKLPPSNLVFLIDVSGSMNSPDKLPLVKEAFALLAEQLSEKDRVSIVTYAGSDSVVIEGISGARTSKIMNAIYSLGAGGSTAGSKGIQTAYNLAEAYYIEGGNNRVILATDGDLNVGITSESGLTQLIEEKRETGVFLSVLGFGMGNIKDNKMEALADHGNGNYAYIDSFREAQRVLVHEMAGTLFTIAKDVKLQVEFNPAFIKGYRLIGYENRLLNAEDFANDAKDAGDVGAGHSVTALYEIAEVDSLQEVGGVELKYQQRPLSQSNEWLNINIRYKMPESDFSRLISQTVDQEDYTFTMSQNMRLASGVAPFGMCLQDSPYKGSATFGNTLRLLQSIDAAWQDEYKAELIDLVKYMQRWEQSWD